MRLSTDWLPDTGWPHGVERQVLETVDSTNAEAARMAEQITGPRWILALRQIRGRGRRGRDWRDPEGNFAATLAMPVAEEPAKVALRSFVAALALFDTLVALTGRSEGFSLKWPNDVQLNGGKLAGILLESLPGQKLAIGFGVNLRAAPDAGEVERGANRPVALLPETGIGVTPEEFLAALAPSYADREAQFTTYGFAPIREAWLARAARLGAQVTARTGAHDIEGTFETVDEQGCLVLSTPAGRRAIQAAEVFF